MRSWRAGLMTAIEKRFTRDDVEEPAQGRMTYLVMPGSVAHFGTGAS
jgi:hypothetical protein